MPGQWPTLCFKQKEGRYPGVFFNLKQKNPVLRVILKKFKFIPPGWENEEEEKAWWCSGDRWKG